MSATDLVIIITAVGVVIINVVTLILTHQRAMLNDERLGRMEATNNQTHALVNSASLATERLLAVALRRIAVGDDTLDNLLAAEAAEKDVREHEKRQAEADAKKKEG